MGPDPEDPNPVIGSEHLTALGPGLWCGLVGPCGMIGNCHVLIILCGWGGGG